MIPGAWPRPLLVLKTEGMLEPYSPAGLDAVDRSSATATWSPSWSGWTPGWPTICYNTVEGEKLGLTPPASWADLTKPEYAGHVVMPNPASSGTGFLDVQLAPADGAGSGWAYMDALHNNIAAYTHSRFQALQDGGSGRNRDGRFLYLRGAKGKANGAPVEIIAYPRKASAGTWAC